MNVTVLPDLDSKEITRENERLKTLLGEKDPTHLKANANKSKFTKEEIKVETQEYINDFNEAVEEQN